MAYSNMLIITHCYYIFQYSDSGEVVRRGREGDRREGGRKGGRRRDLEGEGECERDMSEWEES